MSGKVMTLTYFESQVQATTAMHETADDIEDGINAVRLTLIPSADENAVRGILWVAAHYNGAFKCALAEISATSMDTCHPFDVALLQGDPEISFIKCEADWAMSSGDLVMAQVEVPGYERSMPLIRLR